MKIAVFGMGYVGVTTAACLAREGHDVVGIDINADKVSAINAGKSPIVESGLDGLIADAVAKGRLSADSDASRHLDSREMAFVCVGTPSAPDGAHDMSYIAKVTRQIAEAIGRGRKYPLTVVYRSTMRPGSTEGIVKPIFDSTLPGRLDAVELVYNPEFLRESVAIEDFFNPPKIVIGTRDAAPCARLDAVNAGIVAPVFYTRYREAELTKFVDNTFHAVKVVFANEIGRVCKLLGVDAGEAYRIFVSDTKLNISPNYFRPGGAFGGSCLPKDVRALQHIASDTGATAHLIDSLMHSNEAHKRFLFENCIAGIPQGAHVLMLGLAFKAGSDDLRESPNLDMARQLLRERYDLRIYDPNIVPSKLLGQNLGYASSNLPALERMLISKEDAEATRFDLAIDSHGWAKDLSLKAGRIVDIDTFDW
jgi:GDP-mannose 6-dehydrogenase